ncbi:4-hydroxy-3-methylbut-2-enyl diphosphate reductase [Rickettsiales endosymbiont of Stachyamoeba lipophora]|uniref:4-hydroxy-3-methylbut-2-enyl diphosphate reductase n=1 Tax=Rickettsiales endosymbiont of Stachyamoeba lipophora TaxID=2486578 RepID=UPI000F6483B9|nr:4-hydroxy-3-methylbut-2-enyl diphosphate reductase [Rickettsiales endosymbiont of Stachyamoeba lipophora]AZL15113.1 4-hydroxy-3-methylbut-2-enyl diphosphate reductase [Rickettsiales endosymbiont of Stachyamoeba lipophora]
MKIILAQPRGFCAGVERAIDIVEQTIQKYGPPVYVRHEIVHNKYVVEDLRKKGAIFVEEIDEIPTGAITIFSAHGVSEMVEINANQRKLDVIDATCPLVTKVHREAQSLEAMGRQIIMIGHTNHPEVIGTSGRVTQEVTLVSGLSDVTQIEVKNPDNLGYITQTTLSVDETREIIDALKQRFPTIKGPDLKDICYATQNRQNAVRELCKDIDLLLVIGSENSSNSNRLCDLGNELGVKSYLINTYHDINSQWILSSKKAVGITAGASAPEQLVEQVISHILSISNMEVTTMSGVEESMKFKLPKKLLEAVV